MKALWTGSGLVARIALSAVVVAFGLAIVFTVLFLAVTSLRQRSVDATQSQEVIATANRLQTYVIDLETGARGFAITRDERYLDPWRRAQALYPPAIAKLLHLTEENTVQHGRTREIEHAIGMYFEAYSVPLVDFLRRNPGAAPSVATDTRGRVQIERIRNQFEEFLDCTSAASGSERLCS
jgi:CHASE3 domain sensor protein